MHDRKPQLWVSLTLVTLGRDMSLVGKIFQWSCYKRYSLPRNKKLLSQNSFHTCGMCVYLLAPESHRQMQGLWWRVISGSALLVSRASHPITFFFKKKYLFIWLCQVLFIAHGLSSCGTQALRGMWDLSSPTRDQTGISCIRRQILNHWTTRESPPSHLLLSESDMMVYEVDCF